MNELREKVAIVTGGAAGIGGAISQSFVEAGAIVVVADVDETRSLAAVEKFRSRGGKASAIVTDCGDVAGIGNLVARTIEEYGRLDIIVNNAGVARPCGIMDLTEDDWDRTFRLNSKGVFFCLQAAARQMIAQGSGGRIINIASISGRGFARAANAIYASSKGAVIALTKIAAVELAKHDINVNSICPGVTMTEMVSAIYEGRARVRGTDFETQLREAESSIPIGRMNTPEDIAAMARFLASDGGRNITGQCYNVDGGLVMS
ncbi:MAG: SDR family NAD(P)-dependent oxidoreductase [Alphaproteobacteria bacterium]